MKPNIQKTTSEKSYRRPLLVAKMFENAARISGEPLQFTAHDAENRKMKNGEGK